MQTFATLDDLLWWLLTLASAPERAARRKALALHAYLAQVALDQADDEHVAKGMRTAACASAGNVEIGLLLSDACLVTYKLRNLRTGPVEPSFIICV